jgi:hypothetical protein
MTLSDPARGAQGMRSSARIWIGAWVLIAVSIVVGGYAFYCAEESAVRERRAEDLRTISELKIEQIVAFRAARMADASRCTKSRPFIDRVERWLAHRADSALQEDLLARLELERDAGGYADVLLLDRKGGRALSLGPGQDDPANPILRGSLAEAFSSHRAVLSDLYRDSIGGGASGRRGTALRRGRPPRGGHRPAF